jgi:hypothetical protein
MVQQVRYAFYSMTDRTWSSFATRSFGGAVAGVECVFDCFRPRVDRAVSYKTIRLVLAHFGLHLPVELGLIWFPVADCLDNFDRSPNQHSEYDRSNQVFHSFHKN